MLENGDDIELDPEELTVAEDELKDNTSGEEVDEDNIKLLGDDKELEEETPEFDDEVESNEDELDTYELLLIPIEDDELADEAGKEVLLHRSTVLQTWKSLQDVVFPPSFGVALPKV